MNLKLNFDEDQANADWPKHKADVEELMKWLNIAIFYWECNLPKDAGPTEREDLAAAKAAMQKARKL